MEIEFDPVKASSNIKKHSVSFEEAASSLLDPMAMVMEDSDAESEQRFVLVGMSSENRLLTVCYTLRGESIRIISARKATKKEGGYYAQGI